MGFLVGLLRVLLALFVVRLLVRAFAGFLRARAAPPAVPERPQSRAGQQGTELVRDRVCNTFLPKGQALRAMIGGQEEHFCSADCRDRALAAVSRAS